MKITPVILRSALRLIWIRPPLPSELVQNVCIALTPHEVVSYTTEGFFSCRKPSSGSTSDYSLFVVPYSVRDAAA